MTVLGQQLSVSLLGLSYFLLTFPSWRVCVYFVASDSFDDTFTSFERTLLLVILVVHLLNIQFVDKLIPLFFGITPIALCMLSAHNRDVFACAALSLATMVAAIVILRAKN